MRTALGFLAAAICIPVIADASTITGTGGAVSLQFEPHYLRAWRDAARPLRPHSAAGQDVAFDPPAVSSPGSPAGACSGASRCVSLPVTGNSGEQASPPAPNGWEGGSEEDVWSNIPGTPGQSNGESPPSPDSSNLISERDANGGLGAPREIDGDGNIGEAPEPSTVLLMGGALLGLGLLRKKRSS